MGRLHEKFTTEERYITVESRQALYRTSYILMSVGAVLFIALFIQVINHIGIVSLDMTIQKWSLTIRSSSLSAFNSFWATVFGPSTLPVIILVIFIGWFIFAKHAWRPLLFAGGMAVGSGIFFIIENIVKRPRPPVTDMVLGPVIGYSFPSGHVTAATDLFVLVSYLIVSRKPTSKRIVLSIVISCIGISSQVFGRIYLGYHWFSDTMAALCLASIVLGLVIYVDTRRTVRVRGEKIHGAHSKLQTDNT